MLKKIISQIIMLACFLALAAPVVNAEKINIGDLTFQLEPSKASAMANDEVTVSLKVTGDIGGENKFTNSFATVSFPSAAFELIGNPTAGELVTKRGDFNVNRKEGEGNTQEISVLYYHNLDEPIAMEGTFFSFKLRVRTTATPRNYDIKFTGNTDAYGRVRDEMDFFEYTVTTKDCTIEVLPPFTTDAPKTANVGDKITISGASPLPSVRVMLGNSQITLWDKILTVENGRFSDEYTVTRGGEYDITLKNPENAFSTLIQPITFIGDLPSPPQPPAPPDPVTPDPSDPDPVTPGPSDPDPVTPGPSDPDPVTPGPSDPDPVTPDPSDPDPVTPGPSDPDPIPPSETDPESPAYLPSHWAYSYIQNVMDNGIMAGYPDGTFQPDSSITRAEFATSMCKYMEIEPVEGESIFLDMNEHWAIGYTTAMTQRGFILGYDDKTFRPEQDITRQEIAAILDRALAPPTGEKENLFADHDRIAPWALDNVYNVNGAGWMMGDTDGNFRPDEPAKRSEIATVLARLIDILNEE